MTTERPSVSQTRLGSTGEMPEPRDLPSIPDDADDTRGVHLRQLLVHPATLIITGVLAALALVVVGAQVGFGIGAAAAGGILYAFELCAGSLVCNVKGHKKSASELDRICQASAAVARRLQQEASETVASA